MLKEKFERTYDVPFLIEQGVNKYDPWYVVTPENDDQSLFSVNFVFRNALRLNMDFMPQKYAAGLIRSMGKATDEQKLDFTYYAILLIDKGAKLEFSINDVVANPLDFSEWPVEWKKIHIRASIVPISESEDPTTIPYEEIAEQWGILMLGMVLSLLDIVPLDGSEEAVIGYEEGNQTNILANKYERNPINRVLCLKHYGYDCQVCGINFALVYGELGKDFIHVHHTTPVSKMGPHYIVNPVQDLVPVCPNCHAMLHRNDPPLSIQQLKQIMHN